MKDNNPFDNQNIASYSVKTFGESVKKRREQLDISLRKMAKKIEMSPSYLRFIEQGNRPAPPGIIFGKDYMAALSKELQLTESQNEVFKIMAQFTRLKKNNVLNDYFMNNPAALRFFQEALNAGWEDEKWAELNDLIFKK